MKQLAAVFLLAFCLHRIFGDHGDEPVGLACQQGTLQSPIPIVNCTNYTSSPLRLKGFSDPRVAGFNFRFTKNRVIINYTGEAPTAIGGFLNQLNYTLDRVELRWGNEATRGHSLFGNLYAMEMMFMMYKSSAPSYQVALADPNYGIAVIDILFQISSQFTPGMDKLAEAARDLVIYNKQFTKLPSSTFSFLVDFFDYFLYFAYHGSLWTEPCPENVKWMVLKDKGYITPQQLSEFQSLADPIHGAITENRRTRNTIKSHVVSCGFGHVTLGQNCP